MAIGVKRCVLLAIFLCLYDSSLVARVLHKALSVSVLEEIINQKTFTHRVDIVNGKRDERWAIDGRAVDYQEYEEAMLESEKQERRQERLKQQEEQKKHDEFVMQFQRDSFAKIIELSLATISYELSRLSDERLENFFVFEPSTVSSAQELATIKNDTIVRARQMLDQKQTVSCDELRSMMATIESLPNRLRAFYCATVKNAQAHSDDTKLLKDLLAIVSESQ